MLIHVIGSSGFIGKAIYKQLAGYKNVIFYSSKANTRKNHTFFDLLDESTWENIKINPSDKLIFLCWQNLPNYNQTFHITKNLINSIKFLHNIIYKGISKIIITGTCYEYGLKNGIMSEEDETNPINSYGVAKDCLRRTIESICKSHKVDFVWMRIFYAYGEGQNSQSLIPLLNKAIKDGKESFDMSPGDQLRDFIDVSLVASYIIKATNSNKATGIYNIGSGKAISIRDFVEEYIQSKNSNIKLNFGALPRNDQEPLAFWANTKRIISL